METVRDRVRTALAIADQNGQPRPDRAELARQTRATERAVYEALVELDKEKANNNGTPAHVNGNKAEPSSSNPVKRKAATVKQKLTTTRKPTSKRPHRPWPLLIIGLGAAVAVWSGWVGLGQMAGFGVIQLLPGIWDDLRLNTAIVLPLSVEAYAAYALHVWLGITPATKSRSTKTKPRSNRTLRFARTSAIASLAIGAVAQVAYHLMSAAGYTRAPWPIVMLVAIIPVVVLGLASALAKLVSNDIHR
ncbi:hypothetical protein [Amycolatopsis suaedae]|uniref:Uncharacterized protein n=1 Tax=Amycolatopsis suaedae TaxID=2510978 RepID=A0A4Q7J588_9PSEU|nr:hypothetical protein [Amycolatopsis suaedae]RZQ62249.1 hypothetical protein EWH70_18375 [Amycolatopsis suaedae]